MHSKLIILIIKTKKKNKSLNRYLQKFFYIKKFIFSFWSLVVKSHYISELTRDNQQYFLFYILIILILCLRCSHMSL